MFLTSYIAILAVGQTPARTYNGKLGQFYLIGPEARVIGTNERLEFGRQREIAIKGVRTTLSVGTYRETIVAPKGKQLIVISTAIRGFQKPPTNVTTADNYGFRVFDAGLKSGDVLYRGSFTPSLDELDATLERGQSVDLISVYEFPEVMPHFKIAPFYDRYDAKQSPNFDLTTLIKKGDSVFATGPLSHGSTATVTKGQAFVFEEITMRFGDPRKTDDGGWAVPVELSTSARQPVDWGWQYALVELLDRDGAATKAFPAFYAPDSNQMFAPQFVKGQTVKGEYHFYPKSQIIPGALRLTRHSTGRSVTVTGL